MLIQFRVPQLDHIQMGYVKIAPVALLDNIIMELHAVHANLAQLVNMEEVGMKRTALAVGPGHIHSLVHKHVHSVLLVPSHLHPGLSHVANAA